MFTLFRIKDLNSGDCVYFEKKNNNTKMSLRNLGLKVINFQVTLFVNIGFDLLISMDFKLIRN